MKNMQECIEKLKSISNESPCEVVERDMHFTNDYYGARECIRGKWLRKCEHFHVQGRH